MLLTLGCINRRSFRRFVEDRPLAAISRDRHTVVTSIVRWVSSQIRAVRLHALVRGWLVGAALVFVVYVIWLPGPIDASGRRAGGDILHFYGAGYLVLTGRGAGLYDLTAQAVAQRELTAPIKWPDLAPYLNPPILAVAWAPFAALPFKMAYVASTCALLGALLAGLRVLRPHLPALHTRWLLVVGLTILFLPMFRTVTGAQNAALTFALFAGGYASLRARRDVSAGVWLGLLLYKPYFAVLPPVLLVLARRWRAVAAFAATAAAQYVLGAVICGVDWPVKMLRLLVVVIPEIQEVDGPQLISWSGFSQYALPETLAKPVGTVLSIATLAVLLWIWCIRPGTRRGLATGRFRLPDPREGDFSLSYGALIAVTIACSPYAQWYESGVLVIPTLLALDWLLSRRGSLDAVTSCSVAAGFACPPLYFLAPALGWQPLALLSPLICVWLGWIRTREMALPGSRR